MSNILRYFSYVTAAVSAWFGRLDVSLRILLIVMFLDILTGTIRAVVQKKLNSSVAWSGVGKKAMTLVVVGLVFVMGQMLVGEAIAAPLFAAVVGFYVWVEVVSILENAAASGVPIPTFLKDALQKISSDKFPPTSGASGSGQVPPNQYG